MDPVILISKSHAEKRWECERAEYYAYFFGETGLKPAGPAWDYDFGIAIHDALAQVARSVGLADPIKDIAPALRDRTYLLAQRCQMNDADAKQWGAIAEGMIRGFYQRRWPEILRLYDIVHVEAACVVPLGENIWFIARPDLILRNKLTGGYIYWEYKTTGWTDAKWLNAWQKAVQVHSGLLAAQHTLQVPMEGCIIEGLWKGKKQYVYGTNDYYQTSPFAWGWMRQGVHGVLDDQYSYTSMRGKGWERFPTWQLVDGLGPWVHDMPTEILDAQFVRTPNIGLDDEMAADFFEQTRWRVRELRQARGAFDTVTSQQELRQILNRHFPQNFSNCEPAFGHKCEFLEMCWSSNVRRDALGSGLFKRRTIDHQVEFIKLLPVPSEEKAA